MGTLFKILALTLYNAAAEVAHAHTVKRVRNAWLVATFPRVVRPDSVRLWQKCIRVAVRGGLSRHADALEYFVVLREQVEEGRRFYAAARYSGLDGAEARAMARQHQDAVAPLPARPAARVG